MKHHQTKILLLTAASASLFITGCGGSSKKTPADTPTASLSASSSSVARGEKVTLTWSATNADSCAASGDWSGDKAIAGGSVETDALRKSGSYTLTCKKGDKTATKTATVTAGPVQIPTSFTGFPVTLDPILLTADHETSVSYKGQMARGVLRESAKKALKTDGGSASDINKYLKNPGKIIDDDTIIAPVTKGDFIIKETVYNELGTNRNLVGKLFGKVYQGIDNSDPIKGVAAGDAFKTMGVPGDKNAEEVLDLWVNNYASNGSHLDTTNGFNYRQLVPKFLLGSVFYYQSVNLYWDEYVNTPGIQDNHQPYNNAAGKHYTGKEHSWDEGFGWFGAAAHYGELTALQNYEINKMGKSLSQAEALALADKNGDGKASLYTEFNSGIAYYAASFDRDGKSTYGKNVMDAAIEGRTIISNAVDSEGSARKLKDSERASLEALVLTMHDNMESVLAEAVYKYAGLSHAQIVKLENGTETNPKEYYKVWGELKGFMLALQFGGKSSKITKTTFMGIDSLIGFGPVKQDGSQVNGVNGDTFTLSAANGTAFGAYKAKLKTVQAMIDSLYGLKAKQSPIQ